MENEEILNIGIDFINKAREHLEKAERVLALNSFKQAEELFKQNGFSIQYANCLCEQASIYTAQHYYDLALKMLQEAETIFLGSRKDFERLNLVGCLINQAEIYLENGETDISLKLYKRAETICKKVGRAKELYKCLDGQVDVYLEKSDYKTAKDILERILKLAYILKDDELVRNTKETIGDLS